ncbi:MAG: RdgB/HAM1 family non-canonical purine NTP pyrophosphatase [Pseudomonadota bacterium]
MSQVSLQSCVVLASNNTKKVNELTSILSSFGLALKKQSEFNLPDAVENGLSFVENAIIKARHAARLTGLPAIADDSGLEVDALDGKPGIYSARYAGPNANDERNNEHLLEAMKGFIEPERTARYRCVIVYLRYATDPMPIICHGTWEGSILQMPRGEGGFGYDPLFWVASEQCSAAELTPERKAELSHRSQALTQLSTFFSSHDAMR